MSEKSASLSWGIVGCGDVCEVKSGPAFNLVPRSRLFAVMRRDRVKAEDYARRHGVPFYSDSADDVILHPEVNAIYVATPPVSHEMYVAQALRAGKPVYVEKPVTLDSAACERLITLQRMHDVPVSVAHYRRGLALFNRVRQLLDDHVIGEIRMVEIKTLQQDRGMRNWRLDPAIAGGGLFFDLAPHQLDILCWLFGTPERVYAASLNQSRRYEVPDLTVMTALFKPTMLARGVWAFNVAPDAAEDRCDIIGEGGKISFPFFGPAALEVSRDGKVEKEVFEHPRNVQQPMIDAVCRFFRGEGPNPCSLDEALVVMKMMERAGR